MKRREFIGDWWRGGFEGSGGGIARPNAGKLGLSAQGQWTPTRPSLPGSAVDLMKLVSLKAR
jgi:hypothetical protein